MIAIFSDCHDDYFNLKKFLNYCKQNEINKIIFCGDLSNEDTLNYLTKNFLGEIFIVGGNADLFEAKITKKYKNIHYSEKILFAEIEKSKIVVIHKPKELEDFLSKTKDHFDYAFCGHTHRPIIKKIRKTIMANPGTLNGPEPQASFAILNSKTKIIELKIISLI